MRKTSVGRLTLGIVLAVLGIALLLDLNYGQNVLEKVVRYWPVALIFLGLEYVLAARDPENQARVSVGAIVLMGVVLSFAWVYVEAPVSFWGLGDFGFSYPGQEQYVVEIPVDEPFGTASTRLNVEAIHDVTVTGTTGDKVAGTATVIVRARTVSEAKRVGEQLRVEARPSGSTLYLEVERPEGLSKFVSIQPSLTIAMPSDGDLTAKTVSGEMRISGISGDVVANNVSGRVALDGLPSSVEVDVVSGSVDMALNSKMTSVNITTVSGGVLIDAPEGTGGSVDFSSVSGSVNSSEKGIENTRRPGKNTAAGEFGTGFTDIRVRTVSGSLTIR